MALLYSEYKDKFELLKIREEEFYRIGETSNSAESIANKLIDMHIQYGPQTIYRIMKAFNIVYPENLNYGNVVSRFSKFTNLSLEIDELAKEQDLLKENIQSLLKDNIQNYGDTYPTMNRKIDDTILFGPAYPADKGLRDFTEYYKYVEETQNLAANIHECFTLYNSQSMYSGESFMRCLAETLQNVNKKYGVETLEILCYNLELIPCDFKINSAIVSPNDSICQLTEYIRAYLVYTGNFIPTTYDEVNGFVYSKFTITDNQIWNSFIIDDITTILLDERINLKTKYKK